LGLIVDRDGNVYIIGILLSQGSGAVSDLKKIKGSLSERKSLVLAKGGQYTLREGKEGTSTLVKEKRWGGKRTVNKKMGGGGRSSDSMLIIHVIKEGKEVRQGREKNVSRKKRVGG